MALFAAPQTFNDGLTSRLGIQATVLRAAPKELGKG
jgi:hypothetical protein